MDKVKDSNDKRDSTCLDEREMELISCDAGRSVLFRYDCQQNLEQTASDEEVVVPSGESTSQHDVSYSEQQQNLANVLITTLKNGSKNLHYYQGLHDIAGVLLYNVNDPRHASAILKRLARVHLRDAMRQDLNILVEFLHAVLVPLLFEIDSELAGFLVDSGLDICNAILPWIITWFTHDIYNAEVASRLVDAFISSHATLPL